MARKQADNEKRIVKIKENWNVCDSICEMNLHNKSVNTKTTAEKKYKNKSSKKG